MWMMVVVHSVSGFSSVVLGGDTHRVMADGSAVAGGADNEVSSHYGTVLGGAEHRVSGLGGVVVGGYSNHAKGADSTVAGGARNRAEAGAVALGRDAHAGSNGFMFSDGHHIISGGTSEFAVAASGGIHFITSDLGVGACLSPFGGGWSHVSDRDTKHAFHSVDHFLIWQKIASFPTQTWRYKGEKSRHMGPMAQWFYGAFGLGSSETQIAAVDADGVALSGVVGASHWVQQERAAMDDTIARFNTSTKVTRYALDAVALMPMRMKRVDR